MRGECCRLGIKASSIGPLVRCSKSASQFRRWNLAEAKAEWRAVGSMVHLTAVYTIEYIALYCTISHYIALYWITLEHIGLFIESDWFRSLQMLQSLFPILGQVQ
jgi:hypothetical protein